MRYSLESLLPINAFQPRGKAPFAYGMTLEGGGGGGGILAAVAAVVTVVAAVATDGASLAAEGAIDGAAATTDAAVTTGEVADAAEATDAASSAAAAGSETAAASAAGTTAGSEAAASTSALAADTSGEAAASNVAADTSGAAADTASQSAINGSQLLNSAGSGALKSMAVNAGTSLINGKPIDPTSVLESGVTGAIGAGTGNLLSQEGLDPIVSQGVGGALAGTTNAAMRGTDVGQGLLTGGVGGAASGAATDIGQSLNLNPVAQGALSGVIKGGTQSALNNGSVGTGALVGGVVGGATSLANQGGNMVQNSMTGGNSNNTLLGQVLGSGTGSEVGQYIAPPKANTSTAQPSLPVVSPLGIPTLASIGDPTALTPGQPSGQTGIPEESALLSGKSPIGLPGNVAGIPSGSNVDMASSFGSPTTGLSGSGLPVAPSATTLSSGPMTGNLPYSSTNEDDLLKLKQLYPQLASVDPRILTSLVASNNDTNSAVQTYKRGGTVHHQEHIPEFITGATGHYVKGKGDGQSDDIPAMLADGEYVFDADTVAALGNGSSDAGAKLLDHFRESLREHKRSAPTDKIPPKASPLQYMKEALKRHNGTLKG